MVLPFYKVRTLCTFLCNKGGEDITPCNTIDNTFIGRNVYTTAKQGANATLVYLLSATTYTVHARCFIYGSVIGKHAKESVSCRIRDVAKLNITQVLRWQLQQSPNAMSMVCARGVWRASGGFWLVSPLPPPLLEWHSGFGRLKLSTLKEKSCYTVQSTQSQVKGSKHRLLTIHCYDMKMRGHYNKYGVTKKKLIFKN
jgi:hypothetical protein